MHFCIYRQLVSWFILLKPIYPKHFSFILIQPFYPVLHSEAVVGPPVCRWVLWGLRILHSTLSVGAPLPAHWRLRERRTAPAEPTSQRRVSSVWHLPNAKQQLNTRQPATASQRLPVPYELRQLCNQRFACRRAIACHLDLPLPQTPL